MLAKDVMSEGVLTVAAEATIHDAAEKLVNARVSALPVVDARGTVVGIISENDVIQRIEEGHASQSSGILRRMADGIASAATFVRTRSQRVGDVMTRKVVTADENATLGELAGLMVRHGIKRVPITRRDRLVGVVSRIDLLRALISHAAEASSAPGLATDDDAIAQRVRAVLQGQSWSAAWPASIVTLAGAVHLWGVVPDETVRQAYRVAVESVAGVRTVVDHLHVVPAAGRKGVGRV